MPIHWVATYLDPSFRELGFVNDRQVRCKQQRIIQDGLLKMSEDIVVGMSDNENPDVCGLMINLIDLIFTFRLIFVNPHRRGEKTTASIPIHLRTYALHPRLLAPNYQRNHRCWPRWTSTNSCLV